jgi:hypothetical protein
MRGPQEPAVGSWGAETGVETSCVFFFGHSNCRVPGSMNALNFLDCECVAGTLVESAHAFGKSQAMVFSLEPICT